MKISRNEERMLILNMVAEGKITVDESIKLLEAVNEPKENDYYQYSYDMEDKLNRFSQSVDSFAKDVSDKLSDTFKDVEPKVKKATKTVVEKTVNVLADVSESLNETLRRLNECDCQSDGNQSAYGENNADDNEPREN